MMLQIVNLEDIGERSLLLSSALTNPFFLMDQLHFSQG